MPTPDPDTQPLCHLLFAIYDGPEGFEGTFVVRRWVKTILGFWVPGDIGAPYGTFETIEAARTCIPEGKELAPSFQSRDDATIKEVWV